MAINTTDVRALQMAGAQGRIASFWFAPTQFTINISLPDGAAHPLAVYCLDWNRRNRAENVALLDAASGAVLDTRSLSNFANGTYVVWNIAGNVNLQITRAAGNNAVVSGVFVSQ